MGIPGICLYPETHLPSQVFLAFVLGGMMLGGAPILAARPEAFLAFPVPMGLTTSLRFFVQGDEEHLAMGSLAILFTIATVLTTTRIYRTIDAGLRLRFENKDLLSDLKIEKDRVDALNQKLEHHVEERTAELHQAVSLSGRKKSPSEKVRKKNAPGRKSTSGTRRNCRQSVSWREESRTILTTS